MRHRECCAWCGRPVPKRRRDTGYCTEQCVQAQHQAGRVSIAQELDQIMSLNEKEQARADLWTAMITLLKTTRGGRALGEASQRELVATLLAKADVRPNDPPIWTNDEVEDRLNRDHELTSATCRLEGLDAAINAVESQAGVKYVRGDDVEAKVLRDLAQQLRRHRVLFADVEANTRAKHKVA